MIYRPLPYPGHSWSFQQHSIGMDAKTIYALLKCAAPFAGTQKKEGYGPKITNLIIASGILTSNVRNEVPQSWRDYQQLLAELGLIYSTKICSVLTLTELGYLFLAGEIGFSELIGIQALRYQYPNGQKSTIQHRLKKELNSKKLSSPATLTQLQANSNILLKPGTLILRILIELLKEKQNPSLSLEECQAFLIPCRSNNEWISSLQEIIKHRKSPKKIKTINSHSRRNIQDWFKFLNASDLFNTSKNIITLSQYSLSNLNSLENICSQQEDFSSFWIPAKFDITGRLEWFKWFGQMPLNCQDILRDDILSDEEYLEKNYIEGLEEITEDKITGQSIKDINLSSLDLDQFAKNKSITFTDDIEKLLENLKRGAHKRHAKTLLHDRIIKQLAKSFIAQGAHIESDPNSIDLFSTWPSGESAMFEVKTVTQRSLQGRLRSAIGQIEEYAYRKKSIENREIDKVIVLNTELLETSWQVDFLTNYLEIGLICTHHNSYSAFSPEKFKTKGFWLSDCSS